MISRAGKLSFDNLRIAIVGNFNPPDSGVHYQAEVLLKSFSREGARIVPVTYQTNRYLRPISVIRELLRHREQYDFLCIQSFSFWSWINSAAAIIVGRFLRKPTVVVYRGGGFPEFAARYPWAIIPLLKSVDKIIVPSGFLESEFRKYSLYPAIIHNIIDSSDWSYRRREILTPKLLWVRHLESGYNPWMAIKVLRKVREVFPEATLRMAGDGSLKEDIHRGVERENIPGIKLLGHLPLDQLKQHYIESDIFINTTNVDNQPRSVLEAMASGLPVVSTNVGGIPYLIRHQINGLLVPPGNSHKMATAVMSLLEDTTLSASITKNAKEFTKNFAWESSQRRWAEVLGELGLMELPNNDEPSEKAWS